MSSIQQINFLLEKIENSLQNTTSSSIASSLRSNSLLHTAQLFERLGLSQKHENFKTMFDYTAMNLSAIGLKSNDFGKIREGKYVQIIAISHEVTPEVAHSIHIPAKIIFNPTMSFYPLNISHFILAHI